MSLVSIEIIGENLIDYKINLKFAKNVQNILKFTFYEKWGYYEEHHNGTYGKRLFLNWKI